MDIKLSVRAEELGLLMEEISFKTNIMVEEALDSLAQSTYNEAIRLAHQRLITTQQDYINNLSLEKKSGADGGVFYEIGLNEEAGWIEGGFAPYDMKPGLLKNIDVTKKGQGISKEGNRWKTIPFQHRPGSKMGLPQFKNVDSSENNTQTLKQTLSAVSRLNRKNDLNKTIKKYGLGKIIRGSNNKALEGKVGVMKDGVTKNLGGLTKYQKSYGSRTQSTYMTFRRVSDKSDPSSWLHPGYSGANIFPDLERYVSSRVDDILNKFL